MHYQIQRITTLLLLLFTFNFYAQQTPEDEGELQQQQDSTFTVEYDTWAFGGGISNTIMHGDFRSLGTKDGKNFYNFGLYMYADKMFNPIVGVEFKLNYSSLGAAGQYLSEIDYYRVQYVPQEYFNKPIFMEGYSYGFEINSIISLDNLWKRHSKKWNFATYIGMGYQRYTSKLIGVNAQGIQEIIPDANFQFNGRRDGGNHASSIFLNAGLGVKYRLNSEFDIEARTSFYLNNEDHLDAAISAKQTYETFFVTNIGVVYKLGDKEKYAIWYHDKDKVVEAGEPFELVDTDDDGVEDLFDKEPNTPEGAEVYGSGIAIDTDKDGLQDYQDDCPIVPGPIENNGCPYPEEPVVEEPQMEESEKQKIIKQISLLSKAIYFETNKDILKPESFAPLNEISSIMIQYPESKYKIEGHTDSRGADAYNLDLSKRRARTVFNYLQNRGIAYGRLSSEGYGETRPVKTNDTEEGRQYNRRVEINFIDPKSAEGRQVYGKDVSFTEEVEVDANAVQEISGELLALDTNKLSTIVLDSDGDGVTDLYDQEPNTPLGAKVYGNGIAVDADNDGVIDLNDNCPFKIGDPSNGGCPTDETEANVASSNVSLDDSDGDGVADSLDQEPNTPSGVKVYGNGVSVDSDDDGVADYQDDCPFERGSSATNGCPTTTADTPVVSSPTFEDTDGDGVADALDQEPNTPSGVKVYGNGVSVDSDDDGVADYQDNCPFEKGDSTNYGCPTVDKENPGEFDASQLTDSDNDGVADIFDKEPGTPIGVRVYGNGVAIDSDSDNVPDYQDNCPFEVGDPSLKGCPKDAAANDIDAIVSKKFVDSDGDGVIDANDREPNTSRLSKVYGDGVSVDTDADGVPDFRDDCPFQKGSADRNGCPEAGVNNPAPVVNQPVATRPVKERIVDTDGDGIPDKIDRCPLIIGVASNDGCPVNEDTDGDGVFDDKDMCPEVAGDPSNSGCPIDDVSESNVMDQMNILASKIKFARSEGHILKSNNLAILEQMADIMNKFKTTTFKIEVHTNNKPNLKYNLDLSKRRAFAIKKYLTDTKGISSSRLDVVGLGGTQPKYNVADRVENAKNNRVEVVSKN